MQYINAPEKVKIHIRCGVRPDGTVTDADATHSFKSITVDDESNIKSISFENNGCGAYLPFYQYPSSSDSYIMELINEDNHETVRLECVRGELYSFNAHPEICKRLFRWFGFEMDEEPDVHDDIYMPDIFQENCIIKF